MSETFDDNSSISHYRIARKIGAGGMGEVYLAQDTKLDRKVALKILPSEFAEDRDRMSRFVREAKSASALNHPNILTVYEIGESGGLNYIATEFIDGKVLSQHNSKEKTTLESILDISIQIVSALQTAHEAGIVHRDIKPDNVMIRKAGIVKVLDFGLAKLLEKQSASRLDAEAATIAKSITSPGMIMGTPNYMSPEQAIALDANFTLAYVELSINFGNLVDIGALSPKEGLPQARTAAEKALALDETLADAHYNIARIRKFEFEWTSAETAFKRAIKLNPNLAGAHTIYAEYLSQLGRFDEALREIKLAQELDPLRTGLIGNEGSIFYHARRYDEALEKKQIHVSSAAENPFAHLDLANIYVEKRQYAEAILSYQTSIKLEETTGALIYLGRVYALSGKRNEALVILDKLKTTEKYVSPTELAILYAALGDKEKAFASLEKAYTERDFQLTSLKVEPGYDPLRDDPRFQDLLRRVGLPQ